MVDTSNAKWDLSKEEKYAIKWFEEHGFSAVLEKQYISKTIFTVSKDGVSDKYELTQGIKGMKMADVMTQFQKNWDIYCQLLELRQQAGK